MRRLRALTIAWLALLASEAGAESPPAAIHASGFVEGGYALANHADGGRVVGNLYLPRNDEFMLNAAAVKVERPAPTGESGSGFAIEAMAGGHAEAVRAAGLDLGSHADLVQAYGVLNLPAASLQISAGKMATMLGNEVIETVANPNLSVGNQYVFIENFTDAGVDAAWSGPAGWSARRPSSSVRSRGLSCVPSCATTARAWRHSTATASNGRSRWERQRRSEGPVASGRPARQIGYISSFSRA